MNGSGVEVKEIERVSGHGEKVEKGDEGKDAVQDVAFSSFVHILLLLFQYPLVCV